MLIVFEGIDGAGKTTIAKQIAQEYGFHYFAEPSGILSEFIRENLNCMELTFFELYMVFMTDRIVFYHQTLKKLLENNETVILDRSYISTYTYQIMSAPQYTDKMSEIFKLVGMPYKIDVLIYLDIDPEEAIRRKSDNDYFQNLKTLYKVYFNYKEFLRKNSLRIPTIYTVNANKTYDEVYRKVKAIIEEVVVLDKVEIEDKKYINI